jgi:adenylate cyclase
MEGVFHLRGSDVFRVLSIVPMPGPLAAPPREAPRNLLAALRQSSAEIAGAADLGDLFDRTLACLKRHFGIGQAMILMLDRAAGRLFTVASIGYERSGIGSEILLGQGVVGVAAREGVPIRIGHMTAEYSYGAAVRDEARDHGVAGLEATEIPYPGLAAPESQIALPIQAKGRTLGVLFAESSEPLRFRYDDEDALALLAERLGALTDALPQEETAAPAPLAPPPAVPAKAVTVRHYAADDSVFLDHDYLIKGVAGAILWKLLRENAEAGRSEFTNRELRLDPALRLPEYAENLEARLVLLHRRLRDRGCPIRIEKCGRGRFSLCVPGGLALEEIGSRKGA